LLAQSLGQSRTQLHTWPERVLPIADYRVFRALVSRRRAGEPLAYIQGHREFWSLELQVTPAVLIPRPENELLVELALGAFTAGRPVRAADLGTGSGAIAAALARERPGWSLCATDVSPAALEVAHRNFSRYRLGNVQTRCGSWCEALPTDARFDLILSNPPYVRSDDPHLGRGDLRFEPGEALAAGCDGLDAVRCIVAQAPRYLKANGLLLLEHGYDQGSQVRRLLQRTGLAQVTTYKDLAGVDRVTAGRLTNEHRSPRIQA
jgi:release factor glutamine methyltransferase